MDKQLFSLNNLLRSRCLGYNQTWEVICLAFWYSSNIKHNCIIKELASYLNTNKSDV